MFGDELLAGSHRATTWLVWIHLLVMLLLILVLSCCVVAFASDLAPHSSAGAVTGASASASAVLTTKPNYPPLRNTPSRSPSCLIKREPVREDNASSSSRRVAEEEEVNGEGVDSGPASGAPTNLGVGELYRFFRVATLALLKCLGLDSAGRRRGK